MKRKSVLRLSSTIKALEMVDGSKVLGRITTKDGKVFTIIHGDRIVLLRRKRIIQPK